MRVVEIGQRDGPRRSRLRRVLLSAMAIVYVGWLLLVVVVVECIVAVAMHVSLYWRWAIASRCSTRCSAGTRIAAGGYCSSVHGVRLMAITKSMCMAVQNKGQTVEKVDRRKTGLKQRKSERLLYINTGQGVCGGWKKTHIRPNRPSASFFSLLEALRRINNQHSGEQVTKTDDAGGRSCSGPFFWWSGLSALYSTGQSLLHLDDKNSRFKCPLHVSAVSFRIGQSDSAKPYRGRVQPYPKPY